MLADDCFLSDEFSAEGAFLHLAGLYVPFLNFFGILCNY